MVSGRTEHEKKRTQKATRPPVTKSKSARPKEREHSVGDEMAAQFASDLAFPFALFGKY